MFEQKIRNYLEERVPRRMMVLDPLEVVIEGLERDLEMKDIWIKNAMVSQSPASACEAR